MSESDLPHGRSDPVLDELHAALESSRPEERCRAALRLASAGTLDSLARIEWRAADASTAIEYTLRTALDLLRARLRAETRIDVEALHAGLDSPYVEERIQSVLHVDVARSMTSVPHLVTALSAESDAPVLARLIRAILAYRDAAHRDLGLKALAHPDLDVRVGALEGFWAWSDAAVDSAVLVLRDDPAPRIAAAVDVFIIRRGSKESPHHASALLACDSIARKLVAIFAISGVSEPWARTLAAAIIRDEALPLGVRALARHTAVLQTLHLRATTEGVTTAEDPTVRTDLTRQLPPLPDAASLRAALQSREPLIRLHALQNASRFPASETMPILERLVRWEQDALVVATLVKAVPRVGGAAQAHLILRFLSHSDSRVRANALEALSEADGAIDVVSICKARVIEDESPRVRTLAAAYLFRKAPTQAVDSFRKIVLGADAAARESALLILTTVPDEGVLGVFREALRDPRRDVYQRTYQVLESLAHTWEPAAVLRREFQAGRVAGEVVDDEPVSALLEAVNSPALTDRIHAIQKLARAADSRVDVVLELNMVARNATLRREAWAALNTRHAQVTLPNLYRRLGSSYLEFTGTGHGLVPRALRLRIRDLEGSSGSNPDRERQVGRILYEWFERDLPMDVAMRRICLEIQTASAHIGAFGDSGGSGAVAAGDAVHQGRAAALIAQISDQDLTAVPGDDSPAKGGWGSPGRALALSLGLAGVVAVAAVIFTQSGGAGSAGEEVAKTTAPDGEEGKLNLNRMASERDPSRFESRFGSQKVEFRASFDRVGDDLVTAYVWAGSIPFIIHPGLTTDRLPRNLQRHQPCVVQGIVRDRSADGAIAIVGSMKIAAP